MSATTANNLFATAKAYLVKWALRQYVQEPPVSTVARAIADKFGNIIFEGDGKTLIGITTSKGLAKGVVTTLTGSADVIDISKGDIFILNRSGAVDAATLADPGAGDEGRTIWIKNGTTQANTITTSGLGGSGSSYDVITFTNVVAANVTLRAYGLKWYLVGQHLAAVA